MKQKIMDGMKSVLLNCWDTTEVYDSTAAAWRHTGETTQTAIYLLDIVVSTGYVLAIDLYLFGMSPLLAAGIVVAFVPLFVLNFRFGFEKYFTEVGQVRDYGRNWYLTKLAFERQSN